MYYWDRPGYQRPIPPPPTNHSNKNVIAIIVVIVSAFAMLWYLQAAIAWSNRDCDQAWIMPIFHGKPDTFEYCLDENEDTDGDGVPDIDDPEPYTPWSGPYANPGE